MGDFFACVISWGCDSSLCEGRFLFLNGLTVCLHEPGACPQCCRCYVSDGSTVLRGFGAVPTRVWECFSHAEVAPCSRSLVLLRVFSICPPQHCLWLKPLQPLSKLCSHKRHSQNPNMLGLPFCQHTRAGVCSQTLHLWLCHPLSLWLWARYCLLRVP